MLHQFDWMGRSPPTLVQYCRWVEQDTGRQPSFPSDILNAFAGAGKVTAGALDPRMLLCLPEMWLPQALMWERIENFSEGHDRGPRHRAVQVEELQPVVRDGGYGRILLLPSTAVE